jgi:hypothetical protein
MIRINFSKFWIVLLASFAFAYPSFSQDVNIGSPEKTDQKLLGIWRVDFPELKGKLDIESQNKLSQMSEEEREAVWMTADSRIYLFEQDGKYLMTYVDRGVYVEERGIWTITSSGMMLRMEYGEGIRDYRLVFTDKGMMWNPTVKRDELFGVIFLNRLDL